MATVSNLVVKLTTDNKKLKAGLNKANNNISKFATSAIKSAAKIGAALTAGLIGASTVAAFQIKKITKEIDSLAKTAILLNVGVNELQQLQFIAQKAGVTTQNLNLGLQRMTRRLGEAARGGGEAKGALEALGINIDRIAKLSADQQFRAIAKALAKVTDESKQLSLAFKFFDSEGAKIVNAIRLGVDGLGKDFEELGLGISTSQTKAVQDVSDQFLLLTTISESIKQNFVANIAGPLKQILDLTIEWVKSFGGAKAIANDLTVRFLNFVDTVGSGFFFLQDLFNKIRFTIEVIAQTITRVIGKVKSEFQDLVGALKNFDPLNPGAFIGEVAFNVANVSPIQTEEVQRSIIAADRAFADIAQSGVEIGQNQDKFNSVLKELIDKAKQLPIDSKTAGPGTITSDILQSQVEAAQLAGGTAIKRTSAKDRVFKTRDEFGNVSFSGTQPSTNKTIVELRLVGDEAKRLIRAEVREEVEAATRFDRN